MVDAVSDNQLVSAVLKAFLVDSEAGVEGGENDVVAVPLHAVQVGGTSTGPYIKPDLVVQDLKIKLISLNLH